MATWVNATSRVAATLVFQAKRQAPGMPSVSGPAASSTWVLQVIVAEFSLRESRNVRNWVGACRRRNSMTCPLTQIQPQRSTQPRTFSMTAPSGWGVSGVLLAVLGEVIAISAEPNGLNINDGCGSTHLDALSAAVIAHGADLGLAHDGDADRCLAVDATGKVVDGDAIMVVLAKAMQA